MRARPRSGSGAGTTGRKRARLRKQATLHACAFHRPAWSETDIRAAIEKRSCRAASQPW